MSYAENPSTEVAGVPYAEMSPVANARTATGLSLGVGVTRLVVTDRALGAIRRAGNPLPVHTRRGMHSTGA